jgi:hypothetical protein
MPAALWSARSVSARHIILARAAWRNQQMAARQERPPCPSYLGRSSRRWGPRALSARPAARTIRRFELLARIVDQELHLSRVDSRL